LSSKTNGVDNDRLVRALMESNAFVFTSSRGNELSQERGDFGHGVFTYSLIQGLAGSPESQAGGGGKYFTDDVYMCDRLTCSEAQEKMTEKDLKLFLVTITGYKINRPSFFPPSILRLI
jgi:hypothetical protein